jgi:hypothetical protein
MGAESGVGVATKFELETFIGTFNVALARAFISLLRDLGVPLKFGSIDLVAMLGKADASIDERLGKIDQARDSLTEALSAIDELGRQAARQKSELEALTAAVATTASKRIEETERLQTIKALSNLDTRTVRAALDVPTRLQRWIERGLAFALGVGASFIASILYELWKLPR